MHGYKWPINCTRTRTGGVGSPGSPRRRSASGSSPRHSEDVQSFALKLELVRDSFTRDSQIVGGNVAGAKAEAAAKQDSALRALDTLRDGTPRASAADVAPAELPSLEHKSTAVGTPVSRTATTDGVRVQLIGHARNNM